MGTLKLTKTQYRQLAEQAKAAGLALNVDSFERMRCWGRYYILAQPICRDATRAEPEWDERGTIDLADRIDTGRFRACPRPELDWAALEDHEIFQFVVQHEIGHRQDNFDQLGFLKIEDQAVSNECHSLMTLANEVMADRYAWNQIRPGEPIPLGEHGKRMQERTAHALALLGRHVKKRAPCKPEWRLTAGAYNDVPGTMLSSPERAAFIGPRVSRTLIEREAAYHRARRSRGEQGRQEP